MRKITRKFMAVITMVTLFAVTFIQALPASAATMHSIYYSAGNVDNMVSSSTFTFAVPEGCSFEYCAASRFSRKGYKLTSWYVQETGQTVGLTQPSFMPAYDLHVTAIWEPVTYSICLAGVGGVTAAGENNIYVDGTYGTTINLPYNPFTKDGYTFAGWEYNDTRYAEGSAFEVPAVISGGRIVLAAVWNKAQAVIADSAPVQTEAITTEAIETTTTTTVTTAASLEEGQTVKYAYPHTSFNSANSNFRVYISDILSRYDELESMEFTFMADDDRFGNVSLGFATQLTNGQTYQQNFAEYVNDDIFTMTIDKDICSQLSYARYFQFVCWQSDSFPIELTRVKMVVKENAYTTTTEEEEEEITTTTTTEITTTTSEETTTTTETTTSETTTTTTETTTSETTTTTTTTETTASETTSTTVTTETTTSETAAVTETTPTTAVHFTLKGDADLDGDISLTDIIVVSKNIINRASYPFANYTAFANADMNNDYEVNGIDTSALIEYNLGK